MGVQERISGLLQKRRTCLPFLQKSIEQWKKLDQEVCNLADAVAELRAHPVTSAEVREGTAVFSAAEIHGGISSALELLHVLEKRLARGTINIGVSGRARVGKSTLLQSFSGLSDEQIPTGSGLPVTAVRSRIFHSSTHTRATLTLHSFATFREQVLEPYHVELGLCDLPSNIAEFKAFQYPASEKELTPVHQDKHSNVAILRRLREMQLALWSYEGELTGGERTIDLSELRLYVAYPTNDQIETARCPRRYLAVRDVRIECSFPYAQIENVGIVDLPGLGEVAANAEKHHLAGLQNEVDVVLLVKRPVEGMAYWGQEDANTTNLLDKARGFISARRDFVFILINRDQRNAQIAASLRDDIRRQANNGTEGTHFQVLQGDATDRRSAYDNVLAPVLEHLAERLPAMDQEIIAGTSKTCLAITPRIRTLLAYLETTLSGTGTQSASTIEDLGVRSDALRMNLAETFAGLVSSLQRTARSGDEDPVFLGAMEAAYHDILAWSEGGFGVGKDKWCANALREMQVDKYSHRFIGDELNRIRVEISSRYCTLDNYFSTKVEELWTAVAVIFRQHLGQLLQDREGGDALDHLAYCLEEATEPCPTLSKAVRDLRALRLDYRTQIHPRVRSALDGLNLQRINPESGEPEAQFTVSVTEAGAEKLYRWISEFSEQAAYQTYKQLVQEALTPALILHAATEQFEDTLIRSGRSRAEFGRLARSCRDDIWPGVYEDLEQANARVGRVRRAIGTVREQLDHIERGQA